MDKIIILAGILLLLGILFLFTSLKLASIRLNLSRENSNKRLANCLHIFSVIFTALFIIAGLFLYINPFGFIL